MLSLLPSTHTHATLIVLGRACPFHHFFHPHSPPSLPPTFSLSPPPPSLPSLPPSFIPLSPSPSPLPSLHSLSFLSSSFPPILLPLSSPSFPSLSSLPQSLPFTFLLYLLPQLKCFTLADGMPLFCIWISRDMDCERARNADLSMSMNRQPVDPYRTDQVCLSVCLSVCHPTKT